MRIRSQQTIRSTVETRGIGFLTGADVLLRFQPAAPDHGIVFQRLDCPGASPIPATIEYAVPRSRRTAIERDGVTVELVEHVLAALAGLQIDNVLVELDAPETPGYDGSCLEAAEALLAAGIEKQATPRSRLVVGRTVSVQGTDGKSQLTARQSAEGGLCISYELDYGPDSPIPAQHLTVQVTPETFVRELAFARTFVLESEVAALKAQGYGSRTTTQDLLVFGAAGVIDNEMRSADECVRHKILDCVGDFALLGCDVAGRFDACRSGHELNRDVVRALKQSDCCQDENPRSRAA